MVENTTLKDLLKNLHHQTFIFDVKESIAILPNLKPFTSEKIDANTIELKVENRYSLNDVFKVFDEQGLSIKSMRNKTNRLEELFMDLVGNHDS